LIGGTLGFSYQNGPWILAIEQDLQWADATGAAAGGAFSTRLEWLYNIRARVGYAVDRFVPYISFGPSYGRLNTTVTLPVAGAVSGGDTRSGWNLGAGIEYAFSPNLTAKLEYLFVCLGEGTSMRSTTSNIWAISFVSV